METHSGAKEKFSDRRSKPVGSFREIRKSSGPSGKANISFSVSGPKGSGTVYVDAKKKMGEWRLKNIVLLVDADKRRVSLIRRGG